MSSFPDILAEWSHDSKGGTNSHGKAGRPVVNISRAYRLTPLCSQRVAFTLFNIVKNVRRFPETRLPAARMVRGRE